MSVEDHKKFMAWWEEENGKQLPYDQESELVEYCSKNTFEAF